jgi:hypothetical protein
MDVAVVLVILAAAGLACSPTIEVPGPPPDQGQPLPGPRIPAPKGPPGQGGVQGSAAAAFVTTQDSDEWVAQSFKIQERYARVLVVGEPAPPTVRVARLDLNARGPAGEALEYKVERSFKTLQDAANEARGGDLIAVLPGSYVGFVIGDKRGAGDGSYIHVKALGEPGQVVINRGSLEDPNWMIYLQAAHHVILEGLHLAGNSQPGQGGGRQPRAGIMIDGAFGRTGKIAHHIAVIGSFSHHHRKWGLHATDSHTVLLQDNLFAHSAEEHGAYASDGSDNWVVRRNVFANNHASGFQANLDPEASFDELLTHPDLRSQGPMQPTRAWVQGLLRAATAKFGEHGFPDGRGVNYIIEGNVLHGNGRAGGAAINLAAMSDSLVQNNLIYGNGASGIALWDNDNLWDEPFAKPGPRAPDQVTGPDALPMFGCQNVTIRNNTVLMSRGGRPALQCGDGSFGCRVRNNILVNDASPSIEVVPTSIYKFDASHNALNDVSYEGASPALKSLAVSLPETRAQLGVNRARLASELVRPGEEPWVILEGSWWKLNPARPDFRPKRGSKLLAGQGDGKAMPAKDLLGAKRAAADLGAFAAAAE